MYKGFSHAHSFARDINVTHSTWLDTSIMMSGYQGSRCLLVETYQGDFSFAGTYLSARLYLYYMQQGI